jgi:hypothetical protein
MEERMTTEPKPAEVMVALPAGTLRLLVGSIVLAVLVMLAMLAFEIVILFKVFDLIDVVEQRLPPI